MIVIGSRGSQLALWQARWTQSKLHELGEESRIEVIKTTGDKITDVPLSKVGSKGLFTKELEEALLTETIDVAVHSLKDMPTELPPALCLRAVPQREDVHDALIGRKLADLPDGARVGTSSLRRAAQLKAARPDLEILDLRGNLDTRLRKLDEGRYDAIVLAAAGLRRLGWAHRITELLPVEIMCPAVGQGALAVETREESDRASKVCAQLDDPGARAEVTAERAVLGALGGGCQVPMGANALAREGQLHLRAVIITPAGDRAIGGERHGAMSEARALGRDLGTELIARGGREILERVYRISSVPADPTLT
jgi:hydroxymethylbilane synthase